MAKTFKPKKKKIEAIQWDGGNIDDIKSFVGNGSVNGRGTSLHIMTSHTAMVLRKGDYITKDGDKINSVSEKQFTDQWEEKTD